ncbi:MAG: hypothetical protein FJZ05_00155 [Candidatus Nealsonbacteria bacterium]|nr:hypothetical protein [Candidatus Nealsonbacteria bacterium]
MYNPEQIKQKSEKEIKWEEQFIKIEQIGDAIGRGIDKKVKETIVALNLNGFPTIDSCEGHIEGGYPAPWVGIEVDNEPEEKYFNQNNIFKKLAEKYGVSCEEVKNGDHEKAHQEAWREIVKNKKTPECKQWEKENKKLFIKLSKLLNEFYRDRKVPDNVKLVIKGMAGDSFRVHNGGDDYKARELEIRFGKSEALKKQKEGIEQRLPLYQKEMQEFGKFLKEKYFRG